jgi:hypothetical protein
MKGLSQANPCITARKCSLKPYKDTKSGGAQARDGSGCCPGQTGHHVLPGAMFGVGDDGKPNPGFKPCGEAYDHSAAPTICLEGADNRAGTHGLAHAALDERIAGYQKATKKNTMSYADAREKSIAAVREVNSNCSADCLRAQLDEHYSKTMKCGENADLKAHSGMAGSGSELADDATAD